VLILIVFGGLFSGLFTATEAGAVGALGTFIVAGATGKLTRVAISRSLIETVTTTGSLLIIGIGATMFTRFLGLSGLQSFIANTVAGADIGYVQLMIIIVLIYLVLGMFMEPFGAMLVTLPVFLPVLEAQQVSLVWFGVFVVKMLEIGMITPPVGLNVFVIRNVASQYASVVQIFKGVIPFLIADMFVIALVIAVPAVVLWLPGFL
jgi:tripartite ATP-independent transporter DctM subunit